MTKKKRRRKEKTKSVQPFSPNEIRIFNLIKTGTFNPRSEIDRIIYENLQKCQNKKNPNYHTARKTRIVI